MGQVLSVPPAVKDEVGESKEVSDLITVSPWGWLHYGIFALPVIVQFAVVALNWISYDHAAAICRANAWNVQAVSVVALCILVALAISCAAVCRRTDAVWYSKAEELAKEALKDVQQG